MNERENRIMSVGLLSLAAILTAAAPALAMNDPVTGRWITRDPLPYNMGILVPDQQATLRGEQRPFAQVIRTITGQDFLAQPPAEPAFRHDQAERANSFLCMSANPTAKSDPLGLNTWKPCPGNDTGPWPRPPYMKGQELLNSGCLGAVSRWVDYPFPMCCLCRCGAFIPVSGPGSNWSDPIVQDCIVAHECVHCTQASNNNERCIAGMNGRYPDGQIPRPAPHTHFGYLAPNDAECEAYRADVECFAKNCPPGTEPCTQERCFSTCQLLFHCGCPAENGVDLCKGNNDLYSTCEDACRAHKYPPWRE